MTQRGEGTGTSSNESYTADRVERPLDVAAIRTYYLKQLDSAGWKTGKIAATDDVAAAPLQAKSKDGKEWRGVLSAVRLAAFDVEVSIRMARPGPQ